MSRINKSNTPALVDHDYLAQEVTEAMEAMEMRCSEGEPESGVDLGYDALMNLEENRDLSEFMRSDDIELMWNLADVNQVTIIFCNEILRKVSRR